MKTSPSLTFLIPLSIWVTGWVPFLRGNLSLNDALAALAAAVLGFLLARRQCYVATAQFSKLQIAGAVALATIGVVADATLPSAVALLWLAGGGSVSSRARDELRLFALLSLPWLATDGGSLAFAFRQSAAWATGLVFQLLGFALVRDGTMLNIEGQPLAVAAGCAGLDTLHATLVAGTWLAAALRGRMYFWLAVTAMPALAWIANTSRVIALGGVAITWGPEAAMGWFHTWGGLAVIVVMFVFAGAWVAFLRKTEQRT